MFIQVVDRIIRNLVEALIGFRSILHATIGTRPPSAFLFSSKYFPAFFRKKMSFYY